MSPYSLDSDPGHQLVTIWGGYGAFTKQSLAGEETSLEVSSENVEPAPLRLFSALFVVKDMISQLPTTTALSYGVTAGNRHHDQNNSYKDI